MAGLFTNLQFTTFGPSRYVPNGDAPPAHYVAAARAAGLRGRVRAECPRRPGVYGMLDAHAELIYVGKAKSLRSRLLSYFRTRGRDPKAGRILEHTVGLVWEPQESEFAALLRELELIRRWQPRFNVAGRPGRRRTTYVCLGRRPAPYAYLAPRPPATAFACFGPVPAGESARTAVRRVNDWFGLRDCPQAQEMIFAEQGELFPVVRPPGCLRFEIGNCLGPCTGRGTQAAYLERVRAAEAFLAGTDLAPLQTLERDMTAAAEATQFERAAALRDKLEILTWLRRQLDHLRRARAEHSFVYPVRGGSGGERWYLIHEGRVAAVVAAPHDDLSRQTAAAAIETVFRAADPKLRLLAADEVDGVLLVASWFRRYPDERARTLTPEQALAARSVTGFFSDGVTG